jgi:DNA-binding LacI/PurR family transcriptional regulator
MAVRLAVRLVELLAVVAVVPVVSLLVGA